MKFLAVCAVAGIALLNAEVPRLAHAHGEQIETGAAAQFKNPAIFDGRRSEAEKSSDGRHVTGVGEAGDEVSVVDIANGFARGHRGSLE